MAPQKRTKRDSAQVDKLIAQVDKLHNNGKGMSINAACKEVGLQNTVYYFRKRKDEALAKSGLPVDTKREYHFQKRKEEASGARSNASELHEHKDIDSLTREYRELENRMNAIKLAIAEKVMSKNL